MSTTEFILSEWLTEADQKPPKGPGVYAFVRFLFSGLTGQIEVLYVGSCKNLRVRISSHEMWVFLGHRYKDFSVYFMPNDGDIFDLEKKLIVGLKPRHNRHHGCYSK